MAVLTWEGQAAPALGTTTQLRDYMQAVHDAMVAIGMVQTTDTGQVDIGTAVDPPGTAYWEVWRFDDTLQATVPIFFKIVYTEPYSGRVGMMFTLGTGSNGSGDITGVRMAEEELAYTARSGADMNDHPCFASSDGSSMVLMMWPDFHFNYGWNGFAIERSRDSAGAPTADGLAVVTLGNGTNSKLLTMVFDAAGANRVEYHTVPCTYPYEVNGQTSEDALTINGLTNGAGEPVVIPIILVGRGVDPWVSKILAGIGGAGMTASGIVQPPGADALQYLTFTFGAKSVGYSAGIRVISGNEVDGGGHPAILWGSA